VLKMEVPAGAVIQGSIADALSLADRGNESVEFEFNRVKVVVRPGNDARTLYRAWCDAWAANGKVVDLGTRGASPSAPAPLPDLVPTIYGPVPRALFVAHPEVFAALFEAHPEIFVVGP
jgi:hypothetical protein